MLLLRSLLAALTMVAVLLPNAAQAVSIMDPFNVPLAMDGGTSKVGDGIAYADGARAKLDEECAELEAPYQAHDVRGWLSGPLQLPGVRS